MNSFGSAGGAVAVVAVSGKAVVALVVVVEVVEVLLLLYLVKLEMKSFEDLKFEIDVEFEAFVILLMLSSVKVTLVVVEVLWLKNLKPFEV